LALGRADGFVIVAEGSEGMPAGTVVPVHLFDNDAIPMTPAP
jgi:molybdopterin biosynthesis enzyme